MMTPKTIDESPLGDAIAQLRGTMGERRAQLEKAAVMARLFGGAASERRIGRYAVDKCLGAGGMGEVYAARDEALDRRVALKLLHSNLDVDADARARMLREAKTLAKLSHPNVVQIYEVGDDDGQIFIAMEFIAGQSLRQWLAAERRGWREVLACYLEAGRGLAAVHRAGLVHRDFKPDNVLLGEDGRVCVADFGLARPVGTTGGGMPQSGSDPAWGGVEPSSAGSGPAAERDSMRITRTNRIAGTPAYMAPEQLRGGSVDARSDQFGFCVALYEGLYGQRPFAGRSLAGRIVAMDDGPAVPPRRSNVPRRLWRLLVRGLAVDPAARFGSMDGLLRALDPARTRRRRALVLGGLVVTAGTAGMVAAGRPPDPCPRASAEELGWGVEERAAVEDGIRSTGLAHAGATADAVLARMDERVEELAQVQQETCEATHVRRVQPAELFEQRMFCLEGVEGRLRGVVGELAQADAEAVDHAVEVVEGLPRPGMCATDGAFHGMLPPASGEQAAAVREAREQLASIQAMLDLGYAPRARDALDPLRGTMEGVNYAPFTAEYLHLQGLIVQELGNPIQAAELLVQAVEIADGSRHDLLAAEIWKDLTLLGVVDLSPRDGAGWLPHARAAARRIGSPPHLHAALSRYEGELAMQENQLDRARAVLVDALERRRALGDPLSTAHDMSSLASLYKLTNEPSSALALHEEQRDLYIESLGPTHPKVAAAEYNIGGTLVTMGEEEEARPHLESALSIWTGRYGAKHTDLALAHIGMQQVELATGTLDRALHHARTALQIRRANLPADHVQVAEAEMAVGMAEFFAGNLPESINAYETAWNGLRATYGDDDPNTALARANLAEALLAIGRQTEASAHAEAAWSKLQIVLPGHPASVNAIKVRGQIALARGELDLAIALLREAVSLTDSADTLFERGDILLSLSQALVELGNVGEAAVIATEAREVFARKPGELGRRGFQRAQQQALEIRASSLRKGEVR